METKNKLNGNLFVVKDPGALVIYLMLLIFTSLISAYLIFTFAIIAGVILAGLSFIFYKMFQAANIGHVIDIDQDSYSYPGGKSADEITDYIKNEWWIQALGIQRGNINSSQINRVSKQDNKHWNKQTKTHSITYMINIQGSFGSISQSFESPGKRDQLFTLLTQVLNMVDRVVIR